MQIVSATNDQSESSGSPGFFSGWLGAMPSTIQNLPAEGVGAVYNEDGSFSFLAYKTETVTSTYVGLPSQSSSILLSHDQRYIVAANEQAGELTIVDRNSGNAKVSLNMPGVYGVSINVGSSIILAFAQDSDAVYYVRRLSAADSTAYANHKWPANAQDCEPLNLPTYCAIEVNSGTSGASTYAQNNFDHPFKALFSADGGSVYVLNQGSNPSASNKPGITVLPAAPLLLADGSQAGSIPASPSRVMIPVQTAPGTNTPDIAMINQGIVNGNTIYIAGQEQFSKGVWGGQLYSVNMAASPVTVTSTSMADGFATRMVMADDNTLWIGSMRCTSGERALGPDADGCLTVFNTSTNTATWVEPFSTTSMDANCCDTSGDVTGIAAILGLHKVYYVEKGQLYIRSTVYPYNMINNQNVETIGTAVDVAFIDTTVDTDNTIY